jgi:predicted transcriptional regulator
LLRPSPGDAPASALAKSPLSVYGALMQSPTVHPPTADETEISRQERQAWEAQAIEEALRSGEEEGTIPFAEVVAWVESWDTPDELPPPEPRK